MKNGSFLSIIFFGTFCLHTGATDKKLHNRLFQEILTTDEVKDENIIFSPFSIQLCIALAHLGASGETANEIGHVIGYSSNFSHAKISTLLDYLNKQDVLQIANKVYAKKGLHLNTKYETSLQNSLKSSVESIDFDQRSPAAKTISGWIEAQTNHKIKDMVKPDMINDGTKLMLVNAVYFKANWDTEFNNARPGDFTNHDLSISEVPMMHKQMWLPMTHLDTLASHVVKIPYANTNIAMFLVIPDTTSGLSYIEQNLDQLNFMKISTQMESTFMTFEMPKFEFKTGADLVEPLKRMGMPTAFTNEADFSNMLSPKEDMYITDVIHKAYIKVDEKGTEAGAATVITLLGSSFVRPTVTIKADRPFLFAIVSPDYETPLFMGAVKKL